jgi:hypothetical protein
MKATAALHIDYKPMLKEMREKQLHWLENIMDDEDESLEFQSKVKALFDRTFDEVEAVAEDFSIINMEEVC